MQFDKDTLYKILLVILFIVVIFQILKFFSPQTQQPIIIEGNYENMQSVTGNYDATFYVRDNRYISGSKKPELVPLKVSEVQKELIPLIMPSRDYEEKLGRSQNCICGRGCSCNTNKECVLGSKCKCRNGMNARWNTPYVSGANNTYSDAILQYVAPRMVLDNGCLSCGGNHNKFNAPSGIASDLPPSAYDNDELSMFGNLPEINKQI